MRYCAHSFWAATVTTCASGLLVALTIAAVPVFAPFYLALLTPMTLPLALPIGLALGIAFGHRQSGSLSRHTKRVVLFSAVLVTVLSFSSMAWVKPVANRCVPAVGVQCDRRARRGDERAK